MWFIYCLKSKYVITSRISHFFKCLSKSLCHCYNFRDCVVKGDCLFCFGFFFLWQQKHFWYLHLFLTESSGTVACNHSVASGVFQLVWCIPLPFNLFCHLTFRACFTLWFPIYIIILCHPLVKWFLFDRWKYLQVGFNFIFCCRDNTSLFDLIYS